MASNECLDQAGLDLLLQKIKDEFGNYTNTEDLMKLLGNLPGGGGGDGVGIVDIEQTITSNEDGGINVITITLSNGDTETFTVQNGSKGSNGRTPVKGTDYWTESDKAEIIDDMANEGYITNAELNPVKLRADFAVDETIRIEAETKAMEYIPKSNVQIAIRDGLSEWDLSFPPSVQAVMDFVGDIPTTLDNIISLQEEYIGGSEQLDNIIALQESYIGGDAE